MLQRAFYFLHGDLDLDSLLRLPEPAMITALTEAAGQGPARDLLNGLFGPTRRLYKRAGQYSFFERRDLYDQLSHRPYSWLVACAEQFAALASTALGRVVAPHEVLFDAPPIGREVEFNVEVYFPKERHYRTLGEVSPMIRALAREQFDDYVKRVRIFAHVRVANELRELAKLPTLVEQAIERMR
jgi:hypothetical protein